MKTPTRLFRPVYTITQERVQLSASRPVRAQPLRVTESVSPHDHQFYEICLIRDGSTRHRTADCVDDARHGRLIIVAPGQVHAFERVRGLEVVNVYYLSEWLLADLGMVWDHEGLVALFLTHSLFPERLGSSVVQFDLDRIEMAACEREIDDLTSEFDRSSPSRVVLKSALLKLLVVLSRAYARRERSSLMFAFREEVRVVLNAIESAVADAFPLDLPAIARAADVTADHLSRRFRQATGTSPTEFYQRRRVQRAAAMLLDPRNSVTNVAHALGYADAAHLSRFFRRHQGVSPRTYRAQFAGSADGG